MIRLQGDEGNFRGIYILIRKIEGCILPPITEIELLPRRHQAFEFFKPVEDEATSPIVCSAINTNGYCGAVILLRF